MQYTKSIILVILLVFGSPLFVQGAPQTVRHLNLREGRVNRPVKGVKSSSLTPHTLISIMSNADFKSQASTNGWKGTGTSSNPFIISNLLITDTSGSGYGVDIEQVTYHYKLINITVSGFLDGFFIAYGANATLTGCVSHNNTDVGFYVYLNDNSSFVSNQVYNNSNDGFSVNFGTGVQLDSNTIYGNSNGISFAADNSSLTNNLIYNNFQDGIVLTLEKNVTIANNTLRQNQGSGISASFSKLLNITSNTIYNNSASGIEYLFNANSTISSNKIYNNTKYGIDHFYSGNDTLVKNNIFSNSKAGIYSISSNMSVISNNTIRYNMIGLKLETESNMTVRYNMISNNLDHNYEFIALKNITFTFNSIAPSFIQAPLSSKYLLGSTGNTLIWKVMDDNPSKYLIYKNNTLIKSDVLVSNVTISLNIDGLPIGVYNYTIVAKDYSGFSVSSTTMVTVYNSTSTGTTTPPTTPTPPPNNTTTPSISPTPTSSTMTSNSSKSSLKTTSLSLPAIVTPWLLLFTFVAIAVINRRSIIKLRK